MKALLKSLAVLFAIFTPNFLFALELSDTNFRVSNREIAPTYREVCIRGDGCMIIATAADHVNARRRSHNKLVFFTTDPDTDTESMRFNLKHKLGMGQAKHIVDVRLVTQADYDDLKVEQNLSSDIVEIEEDIRLRETDLKEAQLDCGLGALLCGLSFGAATFGGQGWAIIIAMASCSKATFTCTRIATKIKRLELIKRKLERIKKEQGESNTGGSGGGPTTDPNQPSPVPPYNPDPVPGYEIIIKPVPQPGAGCTRHPCPHMP